MVKVCVMCDSLLVKKSVEMFLKDYVSDYKSCNLVISDREREVDKPVVLLGAEEGMGIPRPYTRSSLLLFMDKYQKQMEGKKALGELLDEEREPLEAVLEKLAAKFAKEVAQAVRNHMENQ